MAIFFFKLKQKVKYNHNNHILFTLNTGYLESQLLLLSWVFGDQGHTLLFHYCSGSSLTSPHSSSEDCAVTGLKHLRLSLSTNSLNLTAWHIKETYSNCALQRSFQFLHTHWLPHPYFKVKSNTKTGCKIKFSLKCLTQPEISAVHQHTLHIPVSLSSLVSMLATAKTLHLHSAAFNVRSFAY